MVLLRRTITLKRTGRYAVKADRRFETSGRAYTPQSHGEVRWLSQIRPRKSKWAARLTSF